MRRGTALLVGAAVMAASRLVPASGDTPPPTPELPRAVCSHAVNDPAGDAWPNFGAATATQTAFPNNPGLDILAVDQRLTSDRFLVFLGVSNIDTSTMKQYEATWRYAVSLTYNGAVFHLGADVNNPGLPTQARPGD